MLNDIIIMEESEWKKDKFSKYLFLLKNEIAEECGSQSVFGHNGPQSAQFNGLLSLSWFRQQPGK